MDGVEHALEFLGGGGLLLGEANEVLVLVLDEAEVKPGSGDQGGQRDQDQLVALFFGEFAEVHRVFSG